MNTSWPYVPFGELYAERSRNGLNRPKRVRGTGFPMVNMGELFKFDFIANQPMDLVPMAPKEIDRDRLRAGDLLFARQSLALEGTGKCSIVASEPSEITTFESHLIRVRLDQARADPLFYYYFFKSSAGRATVQSIVMQVAAAGIRASELATLPVPAPPLMLQRKAAWVLRTYDELIENNASRMRALKETSERIYREWFLDFRYPGHDAAPATTSETPDVPRGWRSERLADLTTLISRGIAPKYDESSKQLVINQRCIRNAVLDLAPARRHATVVPAAKVIRFGDILINSTGAGTLGRVAQVLLDPKGMTVDSHVTIVRPSEPDVTHDYLGSALLAREPEFAGMGVGSTNQTELSRTALGEIVVAVPPMALQTAFSTVVGPLRGLHVSLERATANLRATRDILLSRLISGEIDVAELAISVPEVAA